MRFGHVVTAATLSAVMVFGSFAAPAVAWAADSDELQAQVDDALAKLQDYTQQLELANNELYSLNQELDTVKDKIADTEKQIDEKEQELEEGRAQLSERLAESYKQGGSSGILSVVLGTSSLDELVSMVFYADRMADYDADLISQIVQAQTELEAQRSQLKEEQARQEQLVADQQETTSRIQSQVSEQQAYYDGLDSELQAQLQAEAEARRQAAIEAAEKAEADLQDQSSSSEKGDSGSGSNQGGSSSGNQGGSSGGNQGGSSGGNSGGGQNTDNGNAPSSVVSVALAQVGKSYVLGAAGPNSFDCSGLVTYSYGQLGYSLPHSSAALYNVVAGKGHLVTDSSLLSPGDLVFWGTSAGIYHVAIYIGGGQVVHAANPYYGVLVTGLFQWDSQYYVGGGSPV